MHFDTKNYLKSTITTLPNTFLECDLKREYIGISISILTAAAAARAAAAR
jgi:hypothetical protein